MAARWTPWTPTPPPDDPHRKVPNPANKTAAAQVRHADILAAAAGAQRDATLAALRNPPPGQPALITNQMINALDTSVQAAYRELDEADKAAAATPPRVPPGTLAPDMMRLEAEVKQITHAIRMTAYNAGTALDGHYARVGDEAHGLIREALTASGDIHPGDRELLIRLDPLTAPRRTQALAALCDQLNQTASRYPGTDLILRYEVNPAPALHKRSPYVRSPEPRACSSYQPSGADANCGGFAEASPPRCMASQKSGSGRSWWPPSTARPHGDIPQFEEERRSPEMSVAAPMIEHMTEIMTGNVTPVVAPGTDDPPEQVPVPAERLEAEICLMAGHLAAATCRFLDLVGEYDARGGWAAWDMRSCAEWLSWRCQIAPGTAREHVRVARALRTLPVVHGEFAAGRMGYSKVREITRIATPATEAGLAEIMAPMTAGQAERFARAHRNCTQDQPGGGREPRASLKFRSDPDTGELTVSLRLPPQDGAVVLQALRAATGDLDRQDGDAGGQPAPDLSSDAWPAPFMAATADLAAALVAICGGYLGGKIATADNADIYQVHIHTTAEALTPDVPAGTPALPAGHPAHPDRCHLEDGPAISPRAAQRIACWATLSVLVHGIDGGIAGIGRRSRKIPAALRRAVRERDGYRCTFPGCNTRRTEAHHILYWSLGGPTELGNLLLLCSAHHHLVHARGYLITRTGSHWTFTDPGTGRTLAPARPLPGSTVTVSDLHDGDIGPASIQQAVGERLDLDLAIWAALHNGRIAQERYDQDRQAA